MQTQDERLQSKIERLQRQIDEDKRRARPISTEAFHAPGKAYALPDGTMAAPMPGGHARSTPDVNRLVELPPRAAWQTDVDRVFQIDVIAKALGLKGIVAPYSWWVERARLSPLQINLAKP